MPSDHDKIEFLVKTFGTAVIGKDGINVAVWCPSCANSDRSKKKLVIRLDNDHHHCWVCDLRGRSLERLLRKYAPGSLNEYRGRFLGKSVFNIHPKEDEVIEVKIPRDFTLLATARLTDPDVRDTIAYAKMRGLDTRELWRFRLGTCKTGRFRRRLIIPSFDGGGDLNYFVARSIDHDVKLKYINAKIPKKDVIFNEIYIDWTRELAIVEGPMDLMKCDENATCLLGSHFSEEYILFQKIIKHQTPVLLALDPDATKKAQNFAKKLASYGIMVRILDLGSANDVGEMTQQEFATAKKEARGWSENDRLMHLISTIESGSIL